MDVPDHMGMGTVATGATVTCSASIVENMGARVVMREGARVELCGSGRSTAISSSLFRSRHATESPSSFTFEVCKGYRQSRLNMY